MSNQIYCCQLMKYDVSSSRPIQPIYHRLISIATAVIQFPTVKRKSLRGEIAKSLTIQ